MSKAQKWLDGDYDEATKKQVKYLMDNDMKELTESFYKDLEFGTGGLRGIMGVGTNRMNVYTVGAATQGLANYLKKNFAGETVRVAVAHDSRNNSRMFAERVAERIRRISVRRPPPHPRIEFRHTRIEMPFGRGHHRVAQSQGVQRLQGVLDRRRAGHLAPRREHNRRGGEDHRQLAGADGGRRRQDYDFGRGVRQDISRPHKARRAALARERRQVQRHEDRVHSAARRGNASGTRFAA